MRQLMQKSLYQTVDAGDTLSDSGCRRHSIRQPMQKSLFQTFDAGYFLSDNGCRSLLHPLSDRVSPASAV